MTKIYPCVILIVLMRSVPSMSSGHMYDVANGSAVPQTRQLLLEMNNKILRISPFGVVTHPNSVPFVVLRFPTPSVILVSKTTKAS